MSYTTLYYLINIIGLLALFAVCNEDELRKFFFLRIKVIPKCKELITKNSIKCPCVMASISTTDTSFHNLKGIYKLKSYIFIKDEAFVIISTSNPDIHIEIPFKSIIYHNSYCYDRNSGETYDYCFELFFKSSNDIERLKFCTLDYNHRLCKKYPDLLCDDQLFDFVCKNFKTRKEYRGW